MDMAGESGGKGGRKRKRTMSPQGIDPDANPVESPPAKKASRMESLLSFFSPRGKQGEQASHPLPLHVWRAQPQTWPCKLSMCGACGMNHGLVISCSHSSESLAHRGISGIQREFLFTDQNFMRSCFRRGSQVWAEVWAKEANLVWHTSRAQVRHPEPGTQVLSRVIST